MSGIVEEGLDALDEGVQILSGDWRYVYANEAAARQGRKARAELIGRTMLECYPGIERTPMFATLQRCARDRRAETLENEFEYADGRRAWFELRIRPHRDGVVILSLDITERRDTYRQALHDLVSPIIRVREGILLVPLVGALDEERVAHTAEQLLERVEKECARAVIFDVAGVPELTSSSAEELVRTTAMIRLLGARAILTGLSPSAARALVHTGVDLSAMTTTTHLAEGIDLAFATTR